MSTPDHGSEVMVKDTSLVMSSADASYESAVLRYHGHMAIGRALYIGANTQHTVCIQRRQRCLGAGAVLQT